MTFNIRGGLGTDGRRDTARLADAVRAQAPDIVCFQEVHQRLPWSGWVNQPGLLQRALAMPLVFQRNINTLIGGYGIAVAVRLPMTGAICHFLPGVGERRGALRVSVKAPGGGVSVWCTHWGLQGKTRERQGAQMAEWLSAEKEPVIVCGDFNERADAPAVIRLRRDVGLGDAGAAQNLPTYPSDAPTARIDFILHSPGLRLGRCSVPDTQVSDHRPVVADFALV